MLAVLSVTGFMSGAFGQIGRATPLLFFGKKSKQKKLRLFVLREIFISSEKRFFHLCFIAKALKRKASKRNFGYRGALRLPCVKGAPPQAVRDCVFTFLTQGKQTKLRLFVCGEFSFRQRKDFFIFALSQRLWKSTADLCNFRAEF